MNIEVPNTKFVFVDRLNFFSLLYFLAIARDAETIFTFDGETSFSLRMLKRLRRFGIVKAHVEPVTNHIGDVRDPVTGIVCKSFVRASGQVIGKKIADECFSTHPFLKNMFTRMQHEKVVHALRQMMESKLYRECARAILYRWLVQTKYGLTLTSAPLLIQKHKWAPFFKDFLVSEGIVVRYYPAFDATGFGKDLVFGFATTRRLTSAVLQRVLAKKTTEVSVPASPEVNVAATKFKSGSPKIALRGAHQILSFRPTVRSILFWLEDSKIPLHDVVIYDCNANTHIDDEIKTAVREQGLTLLGKGPGLAAWRPSKRFLFQAVRSVAQTSLAAFKCALVGAMPSPFLFQIVTSLLVKKAFWYDFFETNGIKINVTMMFVGDVTQVMALDDLGGVSAAYQYSISDIDCPFLGMGSGETVLFPFAEVHEDSIYKKLKTPVENVVRTGFIYDKFFARAAHNESVHVRRAELQKAGANFIICFFDENSLNRWDIAAPDSEAAEDYMHLLQWLIEDPSIGMVFKPKKAKSLFRRIASVGDLVEKALQTKRCIFLDESAQESSAVFPAEAGAMSDLCIGKLTGTTAALEVVLAGKRCLLVDADGLHAHPFYKWGRENVIFRSWNDLRIAVDAYRKNQELMPQFGRWDFALPELDPFRDGKASLRMGSFLGDIYDALQNGLSRQDALGRARDAYVEKWGQNSMK